MFLILFIFLFVSPIAQAAELEPPGTCQRKFQRGVLAMAQEKKENKAFIPWFVGLGRGSWFAAVRALTGVYEVLTAPLPLPPHYQPIVLPESPLEYLGPFKDES